MDYFNNKAYFSGESQRSAPSPFGYFPDGKRRLFGDWLQTTTAWTHSFKDLKLGPWYYLREWTVNRFFEHLLAVFGLVSSLHFSDLIAHGFRTEILVRRKTEELELCPQIPNPAAAKGKECIRAIGFPSKNGRYRSNVEHYFP